MPTREYYAAHREEALAYAKDYRARTREKRAVAAKAYRLSHVEEWRQRRRDYRQAHPEEWALRAAQRRCTVPSDPSYYNYGGRGIEYRLPNSIREAGVVLIAAIGPRPKGLTLDRIDNNGHYEIGNLRWATRSVQQRNRRSR